MRSPVHRASSYSACRRSSAADWRNCRASAPDVEITGLVGTYTDPKHIIAYTDGEVRRQFNLCFTARITSGQLEISDESTELRFVPPEEIDQLPMHHTQRLRLQHFLEEREKPYLG